MPKIKFAKGRPEIEVPQGANLMNALVEAELPVASSCGGEAVCAKCLIKIVAGAENVSKPNQNEMDLREIHDFAKNERVSCQTEVLGDITVDASYW